jgi:hypothetical protein
MRKWLIIIGLLLAPITGMAQTAAIQGNSYLGGTQSVTSGLKSSNFLDGIIPSATITVFLTGTTTKATLFSNGTGTPLANPFTSNAIGTLNPGGWIFFAAINQGYDVVASGGIAPNTYPAPFTLCTDCFPAQQIIAGGVGQIIAGNNITLSPTNGLGNVTINAVASNPNAFLVTTLSGNVTSSATTIPLTSVANLASTGEILVNSEWITYTGISGNSLTGATRGIHVSAPSAHSAGSQVFSVLVDFNNPSQEMQNAIMASDGALPTVPFFGCNFPDETTSVLIQFGCVGSNETYLDTAGAIKQTFGGDENLLESELGVGPGGGFAPITNSGLLFDTSRQNQSTVLQGFGAGIAGPVLSVQPLTIPAPSIVNFSTPGSTTYSFQCTGVDIDGHTFPGTIATTTGTSPISGGVIDLGCPFSAGANQETIWVSTNGGSTWGSIGSGPQPFPFTFGSGATITPGTPTATNNSVPKVCVFGELSCWITSASVPTGSCTNGWFDTNQSGSPGVLYQCVGNAWQEVGSGGGGGAVSSVFGRTGAVAAASGDYTVGQVTGAAPLASPTLTGTPTVPTATAGTNTTQIASTAFVIANAGVPSINGSTGPQTLAASGTGLSVSTVGGTTTYTLAGGAGTGAVQSFTQFQDAFGPSSGSSTTVGPTANDFTIPAGLTTAQTNTFLATLASGDSVRIPNAYPTQPFTNTLPVFMNIERFGVRTESVTTFGATCNARLIQGTISGATLTVTAGSLSASDVGRTLVAVGTVSAEQTRFTPTITVVNSSTSATLSIAAPFTISTALQFTLGFDDTAAFTSGLGFSAPGTGITLTIPDGLCLVHALPFSGNSIIGQGPNSQLIGFAGEDTLQLPPGGVGSASGQDVGNFAMLVDATIDATLPWNSVNSSGTSTAESPLYRPLDVRTAVSNSPCLPGTVGWVIGCTNGVASVTNGSSTITVNSSETAPTAGEHIEFPYINPPFNATVSSVSGSTVVLSANYTGATNSQQEWFAGSSLQTTVNAIASGTVTYPFTITLTNSIAPTPQAESDFAAYGVIQDAGGDKFYYRGVSRASPFSVIVRSGPATAVGAAAGSSVFPLNPCNTSLPWPVTPTVNGATTATPSGAQYYPGNCAGNAAISYPLLDASTGSGVGQPFSAHFHDINIVSANYQNSQHTAAIYCVLCGYSTTWDNIRIGELGSDLGTEFGLAEGSASANNWGLANLGISNVNNVFRNWSVHAGYIADMDMGTNILDSWDVYSSLDATGPPGTPTGLGAAGGQHFSSTWNELTGGLITSTFNDIITNYQLEGENGSEVGFEPTMLLDCFTCDYYKFTFNGSNAIVGGASQNFYNSDLNADFGTTLLPLINYGFSDHFENSINCGGSFASDVFGSSFFLNWGPGTQMSCLTGTSEGPYGSMLAGNSNEPWHGQSYQTFASGNTNITGTGSGAPFVNPQSGFFAPESFSTNSSLDLSPMSVGWTFDNTAPITHSYAACNTTSSGGCAPKFWDDASAETQYYIGPGQRLSAGKYLASVAFETTGGASTFTFAINAISAALSSCTPSSPLSTTITTSGSAWQTANAGTPYTFVVDLTGSANCAFGVSFGSSSTSEQIRVAYISLTPIPHNLTVENISASTVTTTGTGPMQISPTTTTVSALPTASTVPAGTYLVVSDFSGTLPAACGSGGGTTLAFAISNGTAWSCH